VPRFHVWRRSKHGMCVTVPVRVRTFRGSRKTRGSKATREPTPQRMGVDPHRRTPPYRVRHAEDSGRRTRSGRVTRFPHTPTLSPAVDTDCVGTIASGGEGVAFVHIHDRNSGFALASSRSESLPGGLRDAIDPFRPVGLASPRPRGGGGGWSVRIQAGGQKTG
jgi:hypothetical protein